jgi:RNA-directed DNA polymerase
MEGGVFSPTPLGTPQGGVISPLLLNIALHGMEAALGIRLNSKGGTVGSRAVVRYADDFVVFCESQEDATRVRDCLLPPWLADRGLSLSEEKTRIVHLTEGFNFLGFSIKQYPCPQSTRMGRKLLIRPSKASVAGVREKLRDLWRRQQGQSVQAALRDLNPVVRGWANYFRTVVSSRIFALLDSWMFRRALRYARRTHPTKPAWWLERRYWGRLNKWTSPRIVESGKRV